jgi:hypothetical protein
VIESGLRVDRLDDHDAGAEVLVAGDVDRGAVRGGAVVERAWPGVEPLLLEEVRRAGEHRDQLGVDGLARGTGADGRVQAEPPERSYSFCANPPAVELDAGAHVLE